MPNNFVHILVAYIRLNRRWILPLFIFPFIWRLISLTSSVEDPSNQFLVNKTWVFTSVVPLFIADLLLSLGLGLSFKRKGNESWLSQLPITNFTFTVIPLFLLLTYGLLSYCLVPKAWEYTVELSGFPMMFTLGILPLSTYLSVRSTKNSPTGLFLGVLVGFVFLFFGDLLIRLISGDFDVIGNYSLLLDLSFLRPAIELLCVAFILFVLSKVENFSKNPHRLILIASSCMGLICIALFLQFQERQMRFRLLVEPLEKAVAESKKHRLRCDQFRSFVASAIDGHSAESTLKGRDEAFRAIDELTGYSSSTINRELLNSYSHGIPEGLAEGLVLKNIFSIDRCHIISKFDLQRSLVNTLSKKPSYLTTKDLTAIQEAVWSSLRSPVSSSKTFVEGMITAHLLEILSQRGFIDHQFKLEILEINRDFEEERKRLHNTQALFAFRMPSEKRIHLIFEEMMKEIQVAHSMDTRLNQVISKIEQSSK